MINGETIGTGAPSTCSDCNTKLSIEVLESRAGYYLGTACSCGPYSRETGYFASAAEAQKVLDDPKLLQENLRG